MPLAFCLSLASVVAVRCCSERPCTFLCSTIAPFATSRPLALTLKEEYQEHDARSMAGRGICDLMFLAYAEC